MDYKLDERTRRQIIQFITLINKEIILNTKKIETIKSKIEAENKNYDSINIEIDPSSEKQRLMHSCILENHNLEVEKYRMKHDKILRDNERCAMQREYLKSLLTENLMDRTRTEIQLINLIQIHAVRYFEDCLKALKQKKLTALSYNRYLLFLYSNKMMKEFESYKGGFISDEEIEKLDTEKQMIQNKHLKALQTFKQDKYLLDSQLLYDRDFLTNDILQIVEKLYPNFKDASLEIEEKHRKAI